MHGQQYRWPHKVTTGSLTESRQMLQSNPDEGLFSDSVIDSFVDFHLFKEVVSSLLKLFCGTGSWRYCSISDFVNV